VSKHSAEGVHAHSIEEVRAHVKNSLQNSNTRTHNHLHILINKDNHFYTSLLSKHTYL